ncbi:MAG: right-handed parallel beta-helix repeat-containing protein [Candidatus Thorarchaeota archaeon]|jgi:hypothetical protein
MAVNAATIWEFRATNGSATNGGGYANLNPGTSVDYSNQNASELTINDGATAGIGNTTLTSAGGGFTAAMAGNVIYLQTGTNLTDGWYQITVVTDTNTVTLDRAPDDGVGGVSGADGEVGGALDILTDTFLDDTNVIVAGQTIYIKNDGTMTLTGNIAVTNAGLNTTLIKIEGYNSSRGDDPTGTNRPLIVCGANTFGISGAYWQFKHLRLTTTEASGVSLGAYTFVFNLASNNSSGTAGRYAFGTGSIANWYGVDGQSANGVALRIGGSQTVVLSSYFHDSTNGITTGGNRLTVAKCVIDTCTNHGISLSVRDDQVIIQNTIYNCGTGIDGSTGAYNCLILNNIIDACTTGVSWGTSYTSVVLDYNCWDNTTDTSNVTKGDNAVTGDPSMTDPANGDFSIPSSSNCVDAALDAGDYTGATV